MFDYRANVDCHWQRASAEILQCSGQVPTSPFHWRPSHLSCQVCC